ncbi:MAG: hypothetical protein AB7P08_04670 [Burkholderiales bacterium]
MYRDDYTDARNAVIVALGLWAGAVAAGVLANVFARLPVEVIAALAIFAAAFSVAVVTVDARVRAWIDGHDLATMGLVLLGVDIAAVAASAALPGGGMGGELAVSSWAPALLFGAPLTVAIAVAAVRRPGSAARGVLRRPASKAPARRPAAT